MVVRRSDVARLAGTSPSVVSYVLNDGPRSVAPQTRARVLAAVEELGYRPNGVARSLRMNKTMTLGLVVPDTSNPFFAELARAVEEAAFAHGYTMVIGNAAEDDSRQTAYVRTFLQRQVDGLILVPAHGPASCMEEIERAKTPWVTLDRTLSRIAAEGGETPAAPAVLVDNRGGAALATSHLLDHGRRRIACIAGPEDVFPAAHRVAGWRDALASAGVQGDDALVLHVPFGRRSGYLAARDLFGRHRSRGGRQVDAVFVASDEQALGVLRAVTELGIRCPEDVALASFDGIAAAAYATPALTTMAQPFGQLGQAAMDRLLERIASPPEPDFVHQGDASTTTHTTVLPVTLTARGSCGCPDPPGGDLTDPHFSIDEPPLSPKGNT